MQESQTIGQHYNGRVVDTICQRCRSNKVVISRHRGAESFIASVFPCNKCRCVECYRRFWVYESLTASPRRLFTWGFLVFLAVAATLLSVQSSEKDGSLNRTAKLIPHFDQGELTASDEGVKPTQLVLNDVLSDADSQSVNHKDELLEAAVSQAGNADLLSNAKLKSAESSIAQQESLERLEQAVVEDSKALESLLKVDMNYRVEQWRSAWQSGLADYYLEFYSKSFQPRRGLAFNEWVEQRKKRIRPDKKINLNLSGFNVSFSEGMKKTVMTFEQIYSSHGYSETSRKQLVWVKEGDEWKIISETELKN